MLILVVGINYRTAPVQIRERLSFTESTLNEATAELTAHPVIEGCVVLFTCNRTEIYAAVREVDDGLRAIESYIAGFSGLDRSEIKNYTYTHVWQDAVRHLFRVAAGFDSMLLGETQILGQVRDAYQFAQDWGSTHKILNALFQRALSIGKEIRRKTGIDQNAVSVSYAAVELARQTMGDLGGRLVLVIGAGKMSELAARYLVDNGVMGVIVSNRSYERACILAGQFKGRAVKFDQLYDYIQKADIVISCTAAAHYVVHYHQMDGVVAGRRGRKLLLIDIAVPRDIDPRISELPGVTLLDIDDLQKVINRNLAWRRQVAAAAEDIIEEESGQFSKWLGVQAAVPTITALREQVEQIKQNELRRAFGRLGELSLHDQKVINSLAASIVNQILHKPMTRLKDYALTPEGSLYAEVLRNLFDLEITMAGEKQRPRARTINPHLGEIH